MADEILFDFEKAFSKLGEQLSELSTNFKEFTAQKESKKKEGTEDDDEKKEMRAKLEANETEKKEKLAEEFSKIQGNEKLGAELKDFSADQLSQLIKMSKAKEVNFGKTVKGKEGAKDFSKEITAAEAKIKDFNEAGLTTSAKEAQAELEKLRAL